MPACLLPIAPGDILKESIRQVGESMADVQYRNAKSEHLAGIADVFLTAFPDSVRHYAGCTLRPAVMKDVFRICREAEPESLFVAQVDDRVAGYIFAPVDLPRLVRYFVWHGPLLRMGWRWITGRYGIGLRPALMAGWNWIALWGEARQPELHSDARILSVAVSPKFQGMGIGSGLMRVALDHLSAAGAKKVRLEVRPGNPAAIHIYEKYGFRIEGKTRDTQGEWLIMLADLR